MRKLFSLIVVTFVIGYASFFAVRHVRSQAVLKAPSRALTIYRTAASFNPAKGTRSAGRPRFWAQRSDGSTAEGFSKTLRDGSTTSGKTVTLIPERKQVVVQDYTGSVTTRFLNDAALLNHKTGPSDPTCMTHPELMRQYTVLGQGEFLGFQVVKLALEDKTSREEVWEAPDLGCQSLFYKLELKREDGTVEKGAEEIATSVVLGEPPNQLFAITAAYTERSFSEAMNAGLQKRGNGNILPEDTLEKVRRLDRVYFESKRYAPR